MAGDDSRDTDSDDGLRNDTDSTDTDSTDTDSTDTDSTDTDSTDTDSNADLRDVRGAIYLPQKDWNAYQMWANYDRRIVERDLGYAARLGLNSLRIFASYEYWREDGHRFFRNVERFLSACDDRDIRPLVVLFEAPPKNPPTETNLRATDPESAFGVHSPSRSEVLRPRNWEGYDGSPVHFARRWGEEYAGDDRLLATEIMNEPGDVRPRREFVTDALRTVRNAAPNATLTMGTKDVRFAEVYDRDGDLDAYQFHMNLPKNPTAARRYVNRQRALADELARESGSETAKPVWCTEWQRTLEEPPSRFLPNLLSLGPTMREAREARTIDGDFFWSLMVRPAYLRVPRERGRVNGLFHPDGAVYSRADAEAVAGTNLDVTGRRALPASWRGHSFPYPGQYAEVPVEAADSDEASNSDEAPNPTEAAYAADATPSDESPNAPSPQKVHDSILDRIARLFGSDTRRDR